LSRLSSAITTSLAGSCCKFSAPVSLSTRPRSSWEPVPGALRGCGVVPVAARI